MVIELKNEDKINVILEVSREYNVHFENKTPFEDFGSDLESYNMRSFSDYYEDILQKYGIKDINLYTSEKMDGKYEMIISQEKNVNDKEKDIVIDLTAWDDLFEVINNIDSIIAELKMNDDISLKILNESHEKEIDAANTMIFK